MISESNVLTYCVKILGKALGDEIEIIERLKNRLQLCQVLSEDECNVIIAFVPIVSRSGTDIEAALRKFEAGRPVVLVALHHTFDENHIPPQSEWSVRKEGVLAVDFLFYEDVGLLRCLHNDKALKSVTDYLISLGASTKILPAPVRRCGQCSHWEIALIICGLLILGGLIVILLDVFNKL